MKNSDDFGIRDNLKTIEHYEEEIYFAKDSIDEYKEKIDSLYSDIKNGISRFQNDNQDIIRGIYKLSIRHGFNKICAMYSAGFPVEDLVSDFEYTVMCMEKSREKTIKYDYVLWAISLGILLETDKNNMRVLAEVVEKQNIEDVLIYYLLYASDIGWEKVTNKYYYKIPYSKIKEFIDITGNDRENDSKKMKEYIEKEWFKGYYGPGWKNVHKEYGYVGFWSFETAALCKILELDDKDLENNNHYPYDLVHYKNNMKFKEVPLNEFFGKKDKKLKYKYIKIKNNPSLNEVIPIQFRELVDNLIEDYEFLDDKSFYEKYKNSIELDQIWFNFEEYQKTNKDKKILGMLIVFALQCRGYVYAIDYKDELEDFYEEIENYWDTDSLNLIEFILDNDQFYYAFVPKKAKVKELYEVKIKLNELDIK